MSRRAFTEIEAIGRASPVLTSASSEIHSQLRQAGRSLWESTLGECGVPYHPGQQVDVEICAAHPLARHLAAVPWECILEPRLDKPLAYHRDFSIFRSVGKVSQETADDDAPAALRILILAMDTSARPLSDPVESWDAALDVGGEVAALRANLAHLEASGLATFKVLGLEGPATLTVARDALERYRPHVLHYIGHSSLGADGATTRFLFGDDAGGWRAVSERAFLSLLVGLERAPRLLVFNSCQSTGPLLSAGLPSKLQRLGLKAVIAMRSRIFDSMAVLFADHLYRSLAEGASVGASCREGRRALMLAEPSWGHWILPVLYTADPGARGVRVESSGAAAHPSSSVRVSYRPSRHPQLRGLEPYGEEDRARFPGRDAEVKACLDLLLERRRLILWGQAGVGKTSLLQAGLLPALREAGFQPLYSSRKGTLFDELAGRASGEPLALILDQAETALEDREGEEGLAALLQGRPALLLVAVRDTSLTPLRDLVTTSVVEPFAELELKAFTLAGARRLFGDLRHRCGIELEPGLVEALLADLAPEGATAEPIFLSFVSLVLSRLYRMLLPADRPVLCRVQYEQIGRLRGLLASHLSQVLDRFGEDARASRLLTLLAEETAQQPIFRLGDDLTRDIPAGRFVLAELVAARLVQPLPEGRYALTHRLLAPEILARRRGHEQAAMLLLRARAREELGLDLDPGRVGPEGLAEMQPDGLSRDELAAFLGWALLRGGVPVEERIAGVPAVRLREALGLLWGAASSDLLVQATIFAEGLPVHRRGQPPFALLPETGGEARARFAAEWLFHVLAHHAAQTREDEKKRQPITQLLQSAVGLEQPLNDPKLAPLADKIGLRSGLGFDSGPLVPLSFWPGPALLFGPTLLVAAAASSAVAWSLWPDRSLSFVQLADYLTFFGAVTLSIWSAFSLEALDGIFFPDEHGPYPGRVRSRVWIHLSSALFLLLVLGFFRIGVTTTSAISDWVHGQVFASSDVWWGRAVAVQQLPDDGFAGLLAAGRRLVGMAVALVKGLLVMYGYTALVAAALAPALALACAAQRTVLRSWSGWRRGRRLVRLLEIAVAVVLVGIVLPPAMAWGQQLFLGFQPALWQPDFFLGRGAADFFPALLGRLASSPWAGLLGSGLTLVTLAFALVGESRGRREVWGRLGDDPLLEKGPSLVRPLVAEGTAEALHWSCRLVRRSPGVRGPETVWLLVGLAAGLDEVFLAQLTREEKDGLASDALATLGGLEPTTPGVRAAREEIERRLARAECGERERLEQVRAVLEGLRPPPENTAWTRFVLRLIRALGWRGPAPWKEGKGGWVWSPEHGNTGDRQRALLPAAAATIAISIALVALWHGGALAVCGALGLLFPLVAPFGPPLLEPWVSFTPVVRAAELASPFLLWAGVGKLLKRKSPEEVNMGGHL